MGDGQNTFEGISYKQTLNVIMGFGCPLRHEAARYTRGRSAVGFLHKQLVSCERPAWPWEVVFVEFPLFLRGPDSSQEADFIMPRKFELPQRFRL